MTRGLVRDAAGAERSSVMTSNVGSTDKIVRFVVAVAALVGAFMVGIGKPLGIVLVVVAVIMAITAVVGFCPLYRLFGMNTCRVDKR